MSSTKSSFEEEAPDEVGQVEAPAGEVEAPVGVQPQEGIGRPVSELEPLTGEGEEGEPTTLS